MNKEPMRKLESLNKIIFRILSIVIVILMINLVFSYPYRHLSNLDGD